MKLKALLLTLLCALAAKPIQAQVNMQVFYDFGSDRKFVTMTLEMFKADKWGTNYFFIDHDFNYSHHDSNEKNRYAPGGTYLEISRCLNFWQHTKLAPLSLHVEYDGGITKSYPINSAWLAGLDYFLHDKEFQNTLNLKLMYKKIHKTTSKVPLQFTGVWTSEGKTKHTIFISEPQLWYNVGRHFGCDNLNVGTEIELSNNFGSTLGFKCRPCLGVKWVF